jgi:hypothetical protein
MQILKIFVTLTWILELISQKKLGILLLKMEVISTSNDICLKNTFSIKKTQDTKA